MASKGGGGAGAFVLEIKHSTESHWDQFFSSIFNKVTLRQKILLPVAGWVLVWGGTESDLGAGGRGGPTSFNVTFSSAKKVGCFWWNHFCRKGHSLLPLNLNINFDLLFHITCRSIPVCVRSLLVLSLSVEWHFSLTPHSPKKKTPFVDCWIIKAWLYWKKCASNVNIFPGEVHIRKQIKMIYEANTVATSFLFIEFFWRLHWMGIIWSPPDDHHHHNDDDDDDDDGDEYCIPLSLLPTSLQCFDWFVLWPKLQRGGLSLSTESSSEPALKIQNWDVTVIKVKVISWLKTAAPGIPKIRWKPSLDLTPKPHS